VIGDYAPTIDALRGQGEFIVDIENDAPLPDVALPLTGSNEPDFERLWLESGVRFLDFRSDPEIVTSRAVVNAFTVIRPSLDSDDPIEILIGNRNPGSHKIHENVISVPTRRGSLVNFSNAVDQGVVSSLLRDDGGTPYGVVFEPHPTTITSFHDETVEAIADSRAEEVRMALITKLNWTDEKDRPDRKDPTIWSRRNFVVASGAFILGNSNIDYDPQSEVTTVERVAMHNIIVGVDRETRFPDKNTNYDPLGWVGLNKFLTLIRTKDLFGVSELFGGEDKVGFDMCVNGVCMDSTNEILSQEGLMSVIDTVLKGIQGLPEELIYRGHPC